MEHMNEDYRFDQNVYNINRHRTNKQAIEKI